MIVVAEMIGPVAPLKPTPGVGAVVTTKSVLELPIVAMRMSDPPSAGTPVIGRPDTVRSTVPHSTASITAPPASRSTTASPVAAFASWMTVVPPTAVRFGTMPSSIASASSHVARTL